MPTHGFALPPDDAGGLGRRRSAPGHARMFVYWSTVSAWAGALRAIGGREPSGRGFLTRSDGGPRRAEGRQTLRTARAISARAWCVRRSFAGRASSCVARNLPGSSEASLKTTDERYPLDRPRHPPGRQLDGLPGGGTRVIMRPFWRCRRRLGLCSAWAGVGR